MQEIKEKIHHDTHEALEPGDLPFLDPTKKSAQRTALTAMRSLRFNEVVGQQRINVPMEYWAREKILNRLPYTGFFPRTVDVPLSAATAGEKVKEMLTFLGLTEDERDYVVVWQRWTLKTTRHCLVMQNAMHPLYRGVVLMK